MNILLVSQCSKKALPETRRILDQFAERRGDRTWQTPITRIGLDTLRKLLKKTARRNTAVACHWIRGRNHSELLWIVGNQSKFNEQGAVPTNITRRDVLKSEDENYWHTAEDMALLAGIAALFHDFGKANVLFQKKLTSKGKGKTFEPYRHEWVSLRMFQAYVAGESDEKWLTRLANVGESDNQHLLDNLFTDHPEQSYQSPFSPEIDKPLPPAARAVAWLILTHHRLPIRPKESRSRPKLKYADEMLDYYLEPDWNSPQIAQIDEPEETDKSKKWTAAELKNVWHFKNKTPVLSRTWRAKAHTLGKRALARKSFWAKHWLDDNYTLHISRLALMLADHHYSSLVPTERYQDKKYKVLANTDRETGDPKQQLDEHLVGVYCNSLKVVRTLPLLKSGLASIARHQVLKKRAKGDFVWQNKAYDTARSIAQQSEQQGFFGINMASTGKGKTFANARIMYGLSNDRAGCRFSIALGLRTLTLQTGEALMSRLNLSDDDIAVLIGSQAVKQLHSYASRAADEQKVKDTGSQSAFDLLGEDLHVHYEGSTDGPLKDWLEKSPKLNKMVNAPIMVSTIDHLMPATESARGGKQIAPMLRLLTSDLVLDEIDDFDLADLPAVCRLVNWAGLLGARVLLSSATIPPALTATLFDAYAAGRAQFRKVRGLSDVKDSICCAWFDEFNADGHLVGDSEQLKSLHQSFVRKRIRYLEKAKPVRKAALIPTVLDDADMPAVHNGSKERCERAVSALSNKILQSIEQLHSKHHEYDETTGKKLSIGLVRMANITPLVAVAKSLMGKAAPQNTQIHYCVYHSQFPLVVRSAIESQLDSVLKRNDPNSLWQHESIEKALRHSTAENHIFVVLASPVSEVGRDHDYDWAIVEPSSMRSIIQLAGRVQRHRNQLSDNPNIHLLTRNYKALSGSTPVFAKPGFETGEHKLATTDLSALLEPEQYEVINAISRITEQQDGVNPTLNLAAFEHYQLVDRLTEGDEPATVWWTKPLSWTYEWQNRTRFRNSLPSEDYVMKWNDEEDEHFVFHQWKNTGELKQVEGIFERTSPVKSQLAQGVGLWGEFNYYQQITKLAAQLGQGIRETSITFGTVSLREQDLWFYDEVLGFYREL